MADARPYTPKTLADRWGCSAAHVRKLIRNGKLAAFKPGEKLLRIPAAAVEEYERCANQESSGIESGGPSASTAATESVSEEAFVPPTVPKPSNALPSSDDPPPGRYWWEDSGGTTEKKTGTSG